MPATPSHAQPSRLRSLPVRKQRTLKVSLDREHYARLQQIADRHDMSLDALARQIIVNSINHRR
jgi:predicted DNA-binding ribbon-helix-helix protein